VEGATLVLEAIHSGLRLDAILVAEGSPAAGGILAAVEQSMHPAPAIYQAGDRLLQKAAATEHPQGVIALFEKPPALQTSRIREQALPVLALVDVQDPGNCGTLVRTFLAFGGRSVITAGATSDLFGPKSVRASAGAVFRAQCLHFGSPEEMMADPDMAALPWIGTSPTAGTPPEKCRISPPFLLLIGNEGSGLPPALLSRCRERLSLPMAPAMESLNAAVAGALILYELSRGMGLGPFSSDRVKP
jgi:RNA methyltransferase, TrmH family